jgi:lamin tail-like protein
MKTTLLMACMTAVALAAGAAFAQDTGDPNVIHACKHPSGGWLRQVSTSTQCRRREKAVSWNIAGAKGEKGDPGSPGPAGAAGAKGDKGDPGTVVTGLGTLKGVPCIASDEAAGEIEVTIAANGDGALKCVAAPDQPPPPPAEQAKLVLNEVDYDQVGTDGNGFVEIANTGGSAADLAGLDLVAINGGDSSEYGRVHLTGTLAPGGYVDVAIELQNGAPDGIALLQGATLLDALSYEGAITAATIGGQTYNLVEGTVLPAAVEDSNTIAGSLIRNPDGKDTNDAASDWAFTTTVTRGAANVMTP